MRTSRAKSTSQCQKETLRKGTAGVPCQSQDLNCEIRPVSSFNGEIFVSQRKLAILNSTEGVVQTKTPENISSKRDRRCSSNTDENGTKQRK
jgi:hypothetical protein